MYKNYTTEDNGKVITTDMFFDPYDIPKIKMIEYVFYVNFILCDAMVNSMEEIITTIDNIVKKEISRYSLAYIKKTAHDETCFSYESTQTLYNDAFIIPNTQRDFQYINVSFSILHNDVIKTILNNQFNELYTVDDDGFRHWVFAEVVKNKLKIAMREKNIIIDNIEVTSCQST